MQAHNLHACTHLGKRFQRPCAAAVCKRTICMHTWHVSWQAALSSQRAHAQSAARAKIKCNALAVCNFGCNFGLATNCVMILHPALTGAQSPKYGHSSGHSSVDQTKGTYPKQAKCIGDLTHFM
jgi:hypothetical protein